MYGYVSGTNQVMKIGDDEWKNHNQQIPGKYPMRRLSLEVKNVSVTQPSIMIDEDIDLPLGKFVKFSIKDKVTYFTEIIFNG